MFCAFLECDEIRRIDAVHRLIDVQMNADNTERFAISSIYRRSTVTYYFYYISLASRCRAFYLFARMHIACGNAK